MFWKVCKNIYKELSPVQRKPFKKVIRRRSTEEEQARQETTQAFQARLGLDRARLVIGKDKAQLFCI
jgi:hypothetical protein